MSGSTLIVGNNEVDSVMPATLFKQKYKDNSADKHVYLICSANTIVIDKYEKRPHFIRMKFHSFVNQDDKRTIIEIPNFFGFKEASIIDNGLTIKYSDEKISGLELLIRVLRNYCCIKQYIDNEGKSLFRKKISKHEKEICKRNIAKIDNIIQTYCTFDIEYIRQAYGTPKRPTPRSATERLIEGHKTFSQILSDFISMYRTKDIRVIQINCTPQISSAVLNISLSNAKNTAEKVFNNENAFNKKHESTIVTLVEAGLIRYFHPSNYNKEYLDSFPSKTHHKKYYDFLIQSEYDHIGFKIDIRQECIALRRPDDGEPVDCLSRSWNLDTGELEWPLVDTPFSQYPGDSFRGEILPTKIGFESNDKQLLK